MAAGLLLESGSGIDDNEGQVGGGGPGGHVGGVLDVPGAVGDHELALGRGGIAIGHVNGDALLPLGSQAIGDKGQVKVTHASVSRGLGDCIDLVIKQLSGVDEESADEG